MSMIYEILYYKYTINLQEIYSSPVTTTVSSVSKASSTSASTSRSASCASTFASSYPPIIGNESGIHIATKIRDFDLTSLIILLTAHKDKYKNEMIEDKIMYLKCISKQDEWQNKMIEILENLNIQSKYRHILRINTKECLYRIPVDKILYIKFENRHSVFYMNYEIKHEIPRTLKEIYDMLDPRFMYCYKSYIVNIECIEKINKKERQIIMNDGTVIDDVSLSYLKEIMKCI